jgi:Ca2+-binding RTX toxin-like protein
LGWTLLALGALAAPVWAGAPSDHPRPIGSALVRAQPHGGASASADTTIYLIQGTPGVNTVSAFNDSTGRLVVSSPQGIFEPDGAAPECIQDTPTQVSCNAGYIGAIAGDLSGGNDVFTASSTMTTLVGISLVSDERAMVGGSGRDRIVGGLGGDLIAGGGGQDALLGYGGGDLIRGDSGKDTISGGGSSDNLIGGSGPDRLDGGAARDLCNGGGGVDSAKSCNVTKKIP